MPDDYWDDPVCELWQDPREADGDVGYVAILDPVDGARWSLPVTHLGGVASSPPPGTGPLWHVEIDDDAGTLTSSPSIHVPGKFHSPGRVTWRIVEHLEADRAR